MTPMSLSPRCPAAELLAGPPTRGPSAICRVMQQEDARVDHVQEREITGALITDRDKPTVLRGFCCGKGFPKQREGEPARGHYTFCPIWEAAEAAERQRLEAEGRVLPMQEKPKILGDDPEVAADLLGIDPEEMQQKERQFRERHGRPPKEVEDQEALGSTVTTGVEAMEEVANDPEWEKGTAVKTMATHLGGSRAGRRAPRRRGTE